MMEMIYFTLAGVGLYFVSDWLLDRIEMQRGQRFEQRSLIFFAIISLLASITFYLIDWLTQGE